MVLEMKVPHGDTLAMLMPLFPIFLSYVLSFVYIGIYWNNHHHLLHTVKKVTAPILWSNLHLLFWLSLIPFATGWAGENHFSSLPSMLYGIDLFMAAVAYWLLQNAIIASEGPQSLLQSAVGRDIKGKGSILLYALSIVTALFAPWLALAIYVLVALIWLIPDKRIEKVLRSKES
jgi:uncharacterized membrane protein